ncbi:FMN-dependent NADH-azoreductase [Paenibacillus senegalensis]|uniref:FMN-dependent NADH-azoreductase n=1 Tax=Paenibacillus senegalensis TaxID=1465766 RepID=UPI0002897F9D|nr:FMN-dependent NADH-azoreductase [Paenibacillus senegalensis]
MGTVLFIKANDRPADQAVSVRMYERFLQAYRTENEGDEIIELDLYGEELPYYGHDAISGQFKLRQGIEPSAKEKQAADIAERYLNQFLAADKVVFAFPLWNFTVPAPLVTYITYLMQAGKTFKYTPEGPVGLVGDKAVALLCARGGIYSDEGMKSLEMALSLVKNSVAFWGITNPHEVVIEGHNQNPEMAGQIIENGLREVEQLAKRF